MIVFLILHEGSVFLFFSEWGPVNEIEGDEYLHKIFKIFLNQKKKLQQFAFYCEQGKLIDHRSSN